MRHVWRFIREAVLDGWRWSEGHPRLSTFEAIRGYIKSRRAQ